MKNGQEINEIIDALRKIGYFKGFQVKKNNQLSSEKLINSQDKTEKRCKKAVYRRIRKYYKSINQYQKERLRRKLCWLLSEKYAQSEIAEMLGISRRTVIRDMNKIKPYYTRLSRNYFNKLEQDRIKEFDAKLEGKTLHQRFKILSDELVIQRKLWKIREYRRHSQIILIDMTNQEYGIPKISFIPKGKQTLAYPYKIRVHVKANFEGKDFEVDVGGFEIVQRTRNWW
ncbi:hypothetical protein ACFLRN_04525 [Thermoproteota archaeon]